ncbi:phytoene desaturase family protein [Pedobacter heparinus]|uniref:FAD dependent oxidoreductase n=1 Tax=Pedobacter heparinus (strain ATCC 13125 / DSM 2366 / CIP 104194 / JCM 7457 / NBRC 12017 / NCIMB 9290 / NRRL B-14731 / HIM 762-3) TaxID=485917 RepID=C6XWZ5_PEDHD|nr:NAD(P)/FAD-dependent oxidoreductase [Pedobacter heparinus]ACU04289.1 FAD dependent oxidoreductase [Pedobacter heparinus DSM 2366]
MSSTEFDAVVVGSGPNGLAAAIAMQQQGLSVLIIEGKAEIGGGLRSAGLTLPGFVHDVCSAVHPLAIGSPFFNTLPLQDHGLIYAFPDLAAAHPFDDGTAAVLGGSIEETAKLLGKDEQAYLKLIGPLLRDWPDIADDVLGPLHFPKHPLAMARFGLNALTSATYLARRFKTKAAKGLWAGMAAHAIQPLSNLSTSAIGLVLMAAAHLKGWPIPVGGSKEIANALSSYFIAIGGRIETGRYIKSLEELPAAKAVLFDVTPKQLLQIAGHKFSSVYKWQLERYRYGMGVFKVDWALDAPIPFTAAEARRAGTVHIGNTIEEISLSEKLSWQGKHAEKPFVLLAQQSLFDDTRAPEGKHTAWAYCHVPNGSQKDMTTAIEQQVERFAPGFRERILARHTMNTAQVEDYNPNYIGGDINGGVIDLGQIFTRPALRSSPYRTSAKGLYICSSSTPPGGGVHGMCGYHAAKRTLKDIFSISI